MDSQEADEVIYQTGPPGHILIRVYKSGRVERFDNTHTSPPGTDPLTGVTSKDVAITAAVSARIYLPPISHKKLPILLHFHGGGFCIGRPTNPFFHNFLTSIVAKANVLVVTVDYRLAPEHPIPAAYDDAWAALQWVLSGGDAWILERGDLGRVYVGGESAGANIAHHMAMRAGRESGVRLLGMVLIHPFFMGSEAVESEAVDPAMAASLEETWRLVCPSAEGEVDDPRINPLSGGGGDLAGIGCERALVCVAGKDVLRDRGKAYCGAVRGSGWRGELVEYEAVGLGHCGNLIQPTCEEAMAQERVIVDFLNGC